MKYSIFIISMALASLSLSTSCAAKQVILTTKGNTFDFDDWHFNIGFINLDLIKEPTKSSTGYEEPLLQFILYINVENASSVSKTFIPQDDLQVIAGGHSFSDIVSRDYPLAYLKEIAPGMTEMRGGEYRIPKALLKDSLIIRAKDHDIKVSVSQLGRILPFGVSYGGPEE
jgi:hypothetical protein